MNKKYSLLEALLEVSRGTSQDISSLLTSDKRVMTVVKTGPRNNIATVRTTDKKFVIMVVKKNGKLDIVKDFGTDKKAAVAALIGGKLEIFAT